METTINTNATATVLTRGKREVHIIGTTPEQIAKAHNLAAKHSFNRLFNAGTPGPLKSARVIRLAA